MPYWGSKFSFMSSLAYVEKIIFEKIKLKKRQDV